MAALRSGVPKVGNNNNSSGTNGTARFLPTRSPATRIKLSTCNNEKKNS